MSEAALQRATRDLLEWKYRDACVALHVANEGKRSVVAGRQLKRQGMLPGAADWVILGRGRWGCIELKSGCGRLSPSQKNFCSRVEKMGGRYCIARSLDEFEVHLRWILGLAEMGE